MGLPPIKTRPKIDLSSLPTLEILEPKEAPKKEPSLREDIDLSALNLDKKQAEAPEGIDLSSLGGYFKQATIPEGPEYQAPPVDPGDESIGATLNRMLAQTTTAIPTAVRGGAELLRKGIVDPLIAPVEGLSPEHGKSLHKLLRQPLLDLEQLAAEKQQGAEELFEKTVKPASSKPITYKSLKDAPVETLHRALNRVIENAPTTIGQLAVTFAAPLMGFGLNAAIETGSTAASIDALEAEGVKVNPEYKKTVNTVAGVTKAIPDFFSDRLLLKILGSRAGFLPKLVMTALESFTEGSTEGVQNLIDVAAEQGATLTPEEVKNFGEYVNNTFNLAKINPGAAAAYLGINAPRRLLGKTPAEQALNLMRTEEATIVGGLAGGLYTAPGLLNTGGERVTGEQLTPEQIAQLPDGIRKAITSGQPVTQPAPKIDLSALGLPSGEPRGLLQEGFASRPAEPREFIAGPGESEIVTALRSKPNLIPPDVDAAVMDRTLALEEAGATQEQMINDPILKELDQLSREVYSGKVAPPKSVVRQRMSAEPTIGTGRQVTTQERVIPKKQLEQATETPVEAPAETQAETIAEQKPQQAVAPKTTVRKPAVPAQKGDGTPTSANFKKAVTIARESFIASKGKPADVQFKEAAAALKAANVHPVIIDEITNPDRFSRPGEPGEKSDATTRRGRYERAVAPPKELQPGLNRITDAASDFNRAKADYEAAKTDLLGILKQRGVEIITADDGVTPKDIRVLKGKTNLSPAAQRVIKDAIQEAAQKGGFSAETVGQGFQMSVTPVKAFPGERLQGGTFAEQLRDFLKKHKAVKNAEAIFKRAKNSSFDALVDDYLAKRVEGKEGSAYRGEGKNNQAEIYVRRKLSASDPDIEPFRSQIKGLRKKLTSEETQRGADYLTVTKTSGASRVRIAEGGQERITVPKEPAVVREEQPAYTSKKVKQEQLAPIFYSQLERVLEAKLPGSGAPESFLQVIEAFQKKGEFKQEEINWIGLKEWLAEQTGKLTKQQVLDFVRENQVDIREVTSPVNESIGTQNFMKWQVPGGENYRELLLILPSEPQTLDSVALAQFGEAYEKLDNLRKATVRDLLKNKAIDYSNRGNIFSSPHFDEPNILAHVRFNERTDADGKRVLFLEEIQSDWHQKGRQEGYVKQTKELTELPEGYTTRYNENRKIWEVISPYTVAGKYVDIAGTGVTEKDAIETVLRDLNYGRRRQLTNKVPDAPFKTTWHELVMKRMLRYAADNGFDRIAWTTGEQQADRYDLSKQISKVEYLPKSTGVGATKPGVIRAWDLNGRNVLDKNATPEELPDIIGKEVADKIINSEPTYTSGKGKPVHVLEGLDLKIGGKGMKGFYDKILPQFMDKYGKKWGAKTGETYLAPTEDTKLLANDDAEKAAAIGATPVHSINITPAMRESVRKGGQAMFEKQPPYEPNYKKRPDASEKIDKWAREIVDGLEKGRKQGRVILANAINNQFRNESTADLIGQDVRTSDDVAVLAQVFRNPKTETMRYVLVKDGKAVHTTGVTSRLPSSTAIFPYADTAEGLAWLGELMALHKADGYYIIHNHPSGNATASPDDVKQTETIAKGVKGFKGHVIVDSNEYTVIDSSFRPAKQVRNFGEDALLTPSLDHPVLGTKVDSNEAIADIAKRLQTPKGWVTLIGTSKGRVRSIMEVEEAQLSDLKKAAAIARRFATQTGSANIYLHTSDQFWNNNLTTLTKGIKEGFIIDAVSEKGNSADEWLAERTSVFGKERVTKQFGKEAPAGKVVGEASAAKTEQQGTKSKLFDHLTTEERAELEASFKKSEEVFKNVQARLDFGLFDSKLQKNFILASKAVLKALSRAAKSSFVKFGDWSKEMVKLYGQKISSYLTPLWNTITPTSLNIGDEVFINGRPIRIKSKLNHHGSNAVNNTQGRAPNHAKRIRNVLFEVVADDYADTVKPLNSALADRMRKIADAYKLFDGRIRHAVNLTELEKRIRDARFNWTKNLFQGDSPTANLETVYFDEHGNGYTALTQIITDPANNTPDNLTELEKDIVKTYRKILNIAKDLHKRFGLIDSELEDIPNKPRVALTYEAKDAIYTTKEAAPLYQAIVNGLAKANRTQDVKSFKLKAEDVIARRIDGEWEVRSTKDREWQEVDDPQAINRLERAWVRDTLETRGVGIFETFPNYVMLDGKPVPITANNVFDALSALSAETAKISALAREFGPHYRQFLTREQELLRDKGLNTKPITDWLDAYFNRRPVPERFIQSRGSTIGSVRRFGRLVDTTIKTAALSASAPLQFPSVLMALHLTGYKPFFKGAADTFRAIVNRKGIAELAAMGAVHREVYNFSIKKGEIFEDMANAIRQTGGRASFLQQGNKFQSYFTAFGMQAFADQLIKQGGKLSRDQVATLVSLDFTADDLKKIRAGEMKKGDSLYSAIVGRSVRYVTGEGLTGGENSRFLRSPIGQLLFPFSRWPVLQMKRFSKEYQIAKKLLRQGDYKTWFNRTARLFGGAVLAGELQFLLGAMLFGTTMKDAWERPDEEMWERLMNDLLAGAILGPFSRLAWIALQSEQTAERIAASATFWGNIAYDIVNMLTDSHEFANQTTWEKSERLLRKRLPAMKYLDGFRQNLAVLGLGKANDLEYRALKNLRRKWLEENDLGTSYDRRGYRESTVQFRKIYERLVEGNQDINEILGEVLKVKEQELLDKAIKEGRETRGIDEQDAIRSLKASLRFRKFFVIDGKDMSEAQLAGIKAFVGESRYTQMAAHDKLIDELIDSLGTTSRARRRR